MTVNFSFLVVFVLWTIISVVLYLRNNKTKIDEYIDALVSTFSVLLGATVLGHVIFGIDLLFDKDQTLFLGGAVFALLGLNRILVLLKVKKN